MAFLADSGLRPLPPAYSSEIEFDPIGYTFGEGANALEVVVVQADRRPTATNLRAAWNKRSGGRVSPILVVALHADQRSASISGPVELPKTRKLPVYPPIAADKAERICRSALALPDRHAALGFLQDTLPEASDLILGLLNQGLLATHALEQIAHGMSSVEQVTCSRNRVRKGRSPWSNWYGKANTTKTASASRH